MRALKITLAYDGTDFSGWQVQPKRRTVQGELERVLRAITGEDQLRAIASGRTDAGVHALGQVASVQTNCRLPAGTLLRALNAELPDDITVLLVEDAVEGFHAIRDAVSKRYRYVIHDAPLADCIRRRWHWKVWTPLDDDAMRRASTALIGTHDFRSFQSSGADRKTTIRTVTDLTIQRDAGADRGEITLEIEADGFLYNMVRAIVGALVEVGRGAKPPAWIAEALAAHDRRSAAATAPPQGLFLVRVVYGPESLASFQGQQA